MNVCNGRPPYPPIGNVREDQRSARRSAVDILDIPYKSMFINVNNTKAKSRGEKSQGRRHGPQQGEPRPRTHVDCLVRIRRGRGRWGPSTH